MDGAGERNCVVVQGRMRKRREWSDAVTGRGPGQWTKAAVVHWKIEFSKPGGTRGVGLHSKGEAAFLLRKNRGAEDRAWEKKGVGVKGRETFADA